MSLEDATAAIAQLRQELADSLQRTSLLEQQAEAAAAASAVAAREAAAAAQAAAAASGVASVASPVMNLSPAVPQLSSLKLGKISEFHGTIHDNADNWLFEVEQLLSAASAVAGVPLARIE